MAALGPSPLWIQTSLNPRPFAANRMGIKVAELFAGVGGFRLGLEAAGGFDNVWFNQWEPSSKKQYAYDCYVKRFENGNQIDLNWNRDIADVPAKAIPDHDLLVGGFPCQDYSVAATLDKSKGLHGKKGVLWWEIRRILEAKRPSYVLLENVDRLLRSPANQRGRDFAVLLACMRDLGYYVEWRVLNAADHGLPQKRRRVFIFGVHKETGYAERMAGDVMSPNYLTGLSFFAKEFKVRQEPATERRVPYDKHLDGTVQEISDDFDFHFQNAGVMVDGRIWTKKVEAVRSDPLVTLGSVLSPCKDEAFFIPEELIDGPPGKKTWKYFRSAKNEERVSSNGHKYRYSEGAMSFPDPSNQPARTLITGEGGTSPSRSKHAVVDPGNDRIRTLTPEECERLNGFPAGHTSMMPNRWRYFTMGNALVVGLVERMGRRLNQILAENTAVQEDSQIEVSAD